MTTPVLFKGPSFKKTYIKYGMTLIEAYKSVMAFSNLALPIVQRIVNIPGSLHFTWSSL